MKEQMKINDNLYLTRDQAGLKASSTASTLPTNHIVCLDCSGSMSMELPKMREQLKRKVPKLLRAQDTLSIIWFSGRNEYGTLLEAEPVATLTDLKTVEEAIDRWLRPIGLTGFKQPLEEVGKLTERVSKKNPGLFSLFFLSDGYDNQWSKLEILKAVEGIAGKLASATFVEYGFYADRALLTDMAAKAGGALIFANDFDKYAPSFELAMMKPLSGARTVEMDIGDAVGGFAFSLDTHQEELISYAVEGGKVNVPEGTHIYWLTTSGVDGGFNKQTVMYAAMSLFANRMKSDVVYAILKATGDVRFINLFSSCYGKQAYSNFVEEARMAAFHQERIMIDGRDHNLVPAEDAFTLIDLLNTMAEDEDNRVLLDSKDFKYSKISRSRIDSNEVLTAEEQAEIEALTEEMGKTKDPKKVGELAARIAEISDKPEALKFKATPNPDGYSISTLVYNEERPNIGFLVKKEGTVDLSSRNYPKGLDSAPADFPTFIFRNYNVIRDGIVNLERLPVRLTAGTVKLLKKRGLPEKAILGFDGEDDSIARARVTKAGKDREINITFDLKALPIINRKMVNEVSAEKLFKLEYELTCARGEQKAFNTYRKEMFPKTSKGFSEIYGEEASAWLKEQGITDYSGFNPKSVQAPSTDFYMGKELKISLKGLATIPSVKDVKEKLAKGDGKLTPSVKLMAARVAQLESLKNAGHLKEADLVKGAQEATIATRELISERAKMTFAIVVGQIWPKEFKSLDDTELELNLGGEKIKCKMELKDVEIRI